ncbi:RICIN domain-containing protein [Streptomyces sp. NPDC021096]|uniref:RICIN domain-containing protein n=1 Tax=Streptomyces sp. NPDC021096 TaxID=3154792 RepID=UPI0033D7EAD6
MGMRIKWGVGVAAGLAAVFAGVQPASAAGTGTGTYSFVNEATGRCLDGNSMTATRACDGGSDQKWLVTENGGDIPVYSLKNAAHGRCLEIRAGRVLSTTQCMPAPDQQWRTLPGRTTPLRDVASGHCIEDTATTLRVTSCSGGPGQRWTLQAR